jgi:hypothetical protein
MQKMVVTRKSKKNLNGTPEDLAKPQPSAQAATTSLAGLYKTALVRYPLTTNCTMAGSITGGSVLASNILKNTPWDWTECLAMVIVASTFITPMLSYYYGWLNKQKFDTLVALFIDQVIFSPVFTLALLTYRLLVIETLASKSLPSLQILMTSYEKVQVQLPIVMKLSWMFWIPCRYIMLNYVPDMHHIVGGNIANFVWNIVLALQMKD